MIDPGTIVETNFFEPARPADPAFSRTAGGCLAVFEREVTIYDNDHPPDLTPAHDTLLYYEQLRAPYPASAVTAGRDCYRAVYPTPEAVAVAEADVRTLWRLAVATNDDAFAQAMSARWTRHLGAADARAAWLERTVQDLVGNLGVDGRAHVTDAHVAMARQAMAQLEAMGPAQVLHWLGARFVFDNALSGAFALNSDTAIRAAIDDERHVLSILRAIPQDTLSAPQRQRLAQAEVSAQIYGVARLTYLETLAHADLARFTHLVDSTWPGGKRPWLVGTPVPALTADYWFGTPGDTAPAAVPASKTVSLIVFISPTVGRAATQDKAKDAMLRRLHAKYPTLPIILMAVTKGLWANESLLDHPEREAELMYRYVHDSLEVPGIMGVWTGKQRVVTADGQTFPVQLPLLNRYMLDVQDLLGQTFLVDRQGWVVDQGMSLVPLVSRLMTHER